MNLLPFQEFIQTRTGIFFEKNRLRTLQNGIITRMRDEGITTDISYLEYLTSDKDELGRLIILITVNETYFFREKGQILLAAEKLVPEILESKKPAREIRIFCAGCSTGEEPYSIVMALKKLYGNNPSFSYRVIAVDIDSNALLAAKKGFFGKYSFRSFDFMNMKRYLTRSETYGYTVNDDVKRHVEFIRFNLNQKEYPEEFIGADIIFYRNVSIYFRRETQKSIFINLSKILNYRGYIIMGATETFAHNFSVISLMEYDGHYIYRKNQHGPAIARRGGEKGEGRGAA